MPELPEVEQFRRLLLPLVSESETLQLERLSLEKQPPRPEKFLSDQEISDINQGQFRVSSVERKGKLICLILNNETKTEKKSEQKTLYLYVHMGMTGRISTPSRVPELMELASNAKYPPPSSWLKFSVDDNEACFSDPRKFGHVLLKTSLEDFDEKAPDAWVDFERNKAEMAKKLTGQSAGIKGILLDQKRCLSGVGNWVADEVLYQTRIHPDQTYLTSTQAIALLDKLHEILTVACNGATDNTYPQDWLFHYRWNNKKTTKDAHGQTVTFVTSGGRTSAIVASIQKLKKSQAKTAAKTKKRSRAAKNEDDTAKEGQKSSSSTKKNGGAKKEVKSIKRQKKVTEPVKKKSVEKKEDAKNDCKKRRSSRLTS